MLDSIENRIRGFAALKPLWFYRTEGVAFAADTIKRALQLNAEAAGRGLTAVRAFPGLNGEIELVVGAGERCDLSLAVNPNGSLDITQELDGIEIAREEGVVWMVALPYLDMVARWQVVEAAPNAN